MLLEDRNAVVYGGGGAIGGAVALAFAREGAKVFLAGRIPATLERVAEEISTVGGVAETARVDALDELAVEKHIGEVVEQAGGIDVSFNAISIRDVQLTRSSRCHARTSQARSWPARRPTSSRRGRRRDAWPRGAPA